MTLIEQLTYLMFIRSLYEKELEKGLPGPRGFSARNLRYMHTFYEEWSMLNHYISPNIRCIGDYGVLALTGSKLY